MATPEWTASWQAAVANIHDEPHYSNAAAVLRELVKSRLLLMTDIENHPDKFFAAHRMLVDPKKRGTGFCIRFTVQFNLFAGTVVGLGNPAQVKALEAMQDKGELGCFALTEIFAGVNSGLVVNTVADYLPATKQFRIHTPQRGAWKNWISQGLTADKAVVVADLRIDGKSHGPHAFFVDLRVNGKLVPGVTLEDMGPKTVAMDLDNAAIGLDMVVPESTLLSKYAEIRDGQYRLTTKEKMRIEILGQRLLTGRVVVAQWGLGFCQKLYNATEAYAAKKQCWMPGGSVALGSIPHIRALFDEAKTTTSRLERYASVIEAQLSQCLINRAIPPPPLVEAIAVAKVYLVETALQLCFRLKQEVGSYALMVGTGFEHIDFLSCCKFAEGDSRILQAKLCRDASRAGAAVKRSKREEELLVQLRQSDGKDNKVTFLLADAICERTIDQWLGAQVRL